MSFVRFEQRYKTARGRLERSAQSLRRRLARTLNRINDRRKLKKLPVRAFRVRIVEQRVKDSVSLYKKVRSDPKLSIAKALDSMHVRDLLGARVVCNTIADVEYVEESFRKDAIDGLHYVEPPTTKQWLRTPNAESGYRGVHIDVKWPEKGEFNYAELQLRTLLQDAWATLFHDDLYKAATELFPPEFGVEARKLSDLLHRVDVRAQKLVEAVENQRVHGEGKIRIIEAVTRAFYALASFSGASSPRYTAIHRRDRYVVAPEAEFDFRITGECKGKSVFRFPMAGDTESTMCTVDLVSRMSPKKAKLSPGEYKVIRPTQPNRMLTIEVPGAEARHDYRIVCHWDGVFDLPVEYVWCPWADLYREADEVKYDLLLEFPRKPRDAPRLLIFREYNSISEALDAYNAGQGLSASQHDNLTTGRTVFTFKPNPAKENYLCLFRR